jgi:hypothetical protein
MHITISSLGVRAKDTEVGPTVGHTPARRRPLALAVVLLAFLFAVPSSALAGSLRFSRELQSTLVGTPFPALKITALDDNGQPQPGVTVSLSARPVVGDTGGSSATFSAAAVVTGIDGTATVGATANAIAGAYYVRAETPTAPVAYTYMVNRPVGFRPGEKLAHMDLEDSTGKKVDIARAVSLKNFTLIDVCATYCGPCRDYAGEVNRAIELLAKEHGIELKFETILHGNGGGPSTRADAEDWKRTLSLAGPVFHAEGSYLSNGFLAAEYFVRETDEDTGIPLSMLVAPDGTILDRRIGTESAADVVQRVLTSGKAPRSAGRRHVRVPTPRPEPASRRPAQPTGVSVTMPDGQLITDSFTEPGTAQDGAVFGETLLPGGAARRSWGYVTPPLVALPSTGTMRLTLTRDGSGRSAQLRSTAATISLGGERQRADGSYVGLYVDGLQVPIVSHRAGQTIVDVDLASIRTAMRERLEAGAFNVFDGEVTPADYDALVAGLWQVVASADFSS